MPLNKLLSAAAQGGCENARGAFNKHSPNTVSHTQPKAAYLMVNCTLMYVNDALKKLRGADHRF